MKTPKKHLIIISIILIPLLVLNIFCAFSFAATTSPYPIIFVHGIGDASVTWKTTGPKLSKYYEKYYKTDSHPHFNAGSGIGQSRDDKDFSNNLRNSCIYVTFNDYYNSPENQVDELESIIKDTIQETWENFPEYFGSKEKVKVILIAHSMGSLVSRKYIVGQPNNHKVHSLITIDALNTGTPAFKLRWIPYTLDGIGVIGAAVFLNPWFLGFTAVGVGIDVLLHRGGIRVLSPAANSMLPSSDFLKELNQTPLPTNIKYRAIISNSTNPLMKTYNSILGFKNGGDGAVPVESQSLKYAGIPNFSSLDYKEYIIDSPHFEAPTRAIDKIIEVLELK